MWDSLTQEQKWGFQYAAEQMNAYNIAQNNPQLKTNWTAQEVALERLKESANQLWMEVLKRKTELFVAAFNQSSSETQQTITEMLDVPDVIQSP